MNPSGGGSFFTLNPYRGCFHSCRYCYSVYISRWHKRKLDEWGKWVEVKSNAPEVLKREVKKYGKGHIFISTVCDAYQPVEEHYQITRKCLEILAESDFSLFLLTKSQKVVRDKDILANFKNVKVGFSITTLNDEIARIFEPFASLPSHRIQAGLELKAKGIETGILINPILPYFTEMELEKLVEEAERLGFDFIGFDTLHYIDSFVGGRVREIYAKFGNEALNRLEYAKAPGYESELRDTLKQISAGRKIRVEFNF
ncbi:radical SAM protein [bacterium]|nr:radical SAM protein [bacterium]